MPAREQRRENGRRKGRRTKEDEAQAGERRALYAALVLMCGATAALSLS
jgi:hypothetical protein